MKRSSDGSAKKNAGQEKEHWLGEDYQLKIPDVFCGSRGSQDQENRHPGNKRFKVAVTLRLEQYRNAETKYDKSMIVKDIISSVHESGGRFVRQKEGKWYDVGLPKARDKVTTAIRLMLGLKNKVKDPPSEAAVAVPQDVDTPSTDWASFSSNAFHQAKVHQQLASQALDAKVPTISNTEPFPFAMTAVKATPVATSSQRHFQSFETIGSSTAEKHRKVDLHFMERKPSALDPIRTSSDNDSLGVLPPDPNQWISPTSHTSHTALEKRGPPFQSESLVAGLDQQYQFEQAEVQQSTSKNLEVFSIIADKASAADQNPNPHQGAANEYVLAPRLKSPPKASSKDSHAFQDGSKSSEETSSFERSVARRTFTSSSDSNADSNEESTGKQEASPTFKPHDNSPDSLASLDKKPPAI